jgi:hypothetical protein
LETFGRPGGSVRDRPQRHRYRQRLDVQQVRNDGGGHVVRQIGDQFQTQPRPLGQPGVDRLQHLGSKTVLVLQGVHLQHRDVAEIDQRLGCQLMQMRIDLDRDHRCRVFRQHGRQRSGARSDLQHDVVRPAGRRVGQQADQVQIDQEVLPVTSVRRQPDFAEALDQVRNGLTRRIHQSCSSSATGGKWFKTTTGTAR